MISSAKPYLPFAVLVLVAIVLVILTETLRRCDQKCCHYKKLRENCSCDAGNQSAKCCGCGKELVIRRSVGYSVAAGLILAVPVAVLVSRGIDWLDGDPKWSKNLNLASVFQASSIVV